MKKSFLVCKILLGQSMHQKNYSISWISHKKLNKLKITANSGDLKEILHESLTFGDSYMNIKRRFFIYV